jgi:putative transposase
MGLPVRTKLPHAIPQWAADGSWFFITINCVPRGRNQLCRAYTGDAVLAAVRFNHERFVWHCRLCLLMPDHLHAIMAFPSEPGMATTVKNWKKSLLENMASIGNAIFSIIGCATITNWKRKRATS